MGHWGWDPPTPTPMLSYLPAAALHPSPPGAPRYCRPRPDAFRRVLPTAAAARSWLPPPPPPAPPPPLRSWLGAGLDAGLGAWLSAGLDAGLDAGLSAELDARLGAGFNAGLGAGLSARLSAGLCAGLDAELSTGLDAGLSSGLYAGLDAGLGAGLDAGLRTGLSAVLCTGLSTAAPQSSVPPARSLPEPDGRGHGPNPTPMAPDGHPMSPSLWDAAPGVRVALFMGETQPSRRARVKITTKKRWGGREEN
uniref:Uncharacterized protein n=1 Tax=Coturnix japonica TaxID=93934 RepID=A0A8C2TSI3_COTJA